MIIVKLFCLIFNSSTVKYNLIGHLANTRLCYNINNYLYVYTYAFYSSNLSNYMPIFD